MKAYLCIDLKTFFASVECVERKLDPFAVNLVVADPLEVKVRSVWQYHRK